MVLTKTKECSSETLILFKSNFSFIKKSRLVLLKVIKEIEIIFRIISHHENLEEIKKLEKNRK